MNAAIFFSGKYGSTQQYANWIGEATGFPVFNIKDSNADPSTFDFIILGSSIIYFKLSIRKWIGENLPKLEGKSKILFSVSGAGASPKLNNWVNNSLPPILSSQLEHVALRGKLDHTKVSWQVRVMLWIGSLFNSNPEASKDERYGFDYVDKESITPILELVSEYRHSDVTV